MLVIHFNIREHARIRLSRYHAIFPKIFSFSHDLVPKLFSIYPDTFLMTEQCKKPIH